jgi:hypothetical protein
MESHTSVTQKVWGFFSFINTMWLTAIFGIAISIGPAIWSVTTPLRALMAQLGLRLKALIEWCLKEIVIPLALKLHTNGILEVAAFSSSFVLAAQGLRMQPESGLFVTISGLVAMLACPLYSFSLHGRELRCWYDRHERIARCTPGVAIFLFSTPMALHFRSSLLAYVATAGLSHCLGFSVLIFPFCYCIGWKDRDAMMISAGTAASVLSLYCVAKVMHWVPHHLDVFQSPVSVLGSVLLFLCLLIMSNKYYYDGGNNTLYYVWRNVAFLVSAMLAIYMGNVFGMTGLANTATTFLVLWLLEKYCEVHNELGFNFWVLILILSGVMYKAALWLHAHPAFVASLFTGFDKRDDAVVPLPF